ncbi:MAG: efflux RND transporter periplasmic adaptor subunit [Melioribacteraceae bacterium]|nr:efflux RND transporter periplasmic adaptor subunit [Melioribacteraceae bacterium]
MKNKLIIYSTMLLVGILIGAGGFYLIAGNSTNDIHNHIDEDGQLYSCGMHPNIIENEMGTCPICGMNLTPINNSTNNIDPKNRKIIYWRAPMNPNEIYDEPGKSQMGMDLVPVYEDEGSASGVVAIDGATLQSMNVKMELVKSRNLSTTISTNGILETDERKEFIITTKMDGWIEKLYVNYTGQKVRKGQKLIDIYSPDLFAAQQELLTAIKYRNALDNSTNNEMLKNAKRKLELLDITKEDIEKIIRTKEANKYLTLYAPFSGTVLDKNVVEGAMVKTGKELLKIADLSNLWLKAEIYESEIASIQLGSETEVRFSYNPGTIYSGKISFIYPTVNPVTRTTQVRIDIANSNNELKPSMFGSVSINGKPFGELPTIPESAVIRSGKRNIVILSLGEGRFKPVEITKGLYSHGYYQVLSGLKINDMIVSSGQFMIDSESNLRSAINMLNSSNTDRMESNSETKLEMKEIAQAEQSSDNHVLAEMESIVRTGEIDVESIDVNGDGSVFECPMDWNVISDKDGRCPTCNMFLKEYSIEETKQNLIKHGYKVHGNADH